MSRNYFYICGITTDGHDITFDGSCVESYTTYKNDKGIDCVKLNFKSGKTIDVFSEVDQAVWTGDCIETLVDMCIGIQLD